MIQGLYSQVGTGEQRRAHVGCSLDSCCVACLQVGYIRGLVRGLQAWGEWWEGGVATDSLVHGNWSLTMDPTGHNFTGTWWYGSDSDMTNPWVEQRVSTAQPTAKQCFMSTATAQGRCGMPWCSLPAASSTVV